MSSICISNKELNDLYSSPNTMESRRKKQPRKVARKGEKRNAWRVVIGKAGRDHLEDLGIDGEIVLNGC
jgi:hypothetical protein